MKITEIDANFRPVSVGRNDVSWISPFEKPIEINGLHKPCETGSFERFPESLRNNENINEGCRILSKHTAGGRIRFATNSPFVALEVELQEIFLMSHMPLTGISGVDCYIAKRGNRDLRFVASVFPGADETAYGGICELDARSPSYGEYEVLLNLPLYNGVKSLHIGILEGSEIFAPAPFDFEKPIAFYGSSITQGGCASRPGNNYMNHICRWLNCDFYNFGFSGSAMGEKEVAQFIASHELSAFVLDYDANAPTVGHLKETHYPFYEIIRNAHPEIPIVMASMPKPYRVYGQRERRNACDCDAVVIESYLKAYKEDKNVYYLDGGSWFGGADPDACTVDNCHPNDLGFYRMAKNMYPVLKRALFK